MPTTAPLSRSAALAAVLAVLGCASRPGASEPAEAPAEPAAAQAGGAALSAPFELGAVVRQVHFAFRPAAQGFAGGHDTYAAVTAADALTVTPVAPARDGIPTRRGAAGRFRTVAPGASTGARAEADGSLAVERGGSTERWRNTEAGVEQTWSFTRRPAAGPLTVRVAVDGLAYAAATAGGLHFVDPATGLGLRYGHATWVGADGRRTAVPARWEGGVIALTVDAATVAGTAFPAVLDPVIGPEFGLDNALAPSASLFVTRPRIAFNGTHYLVVWADRSLHEGDVVGARLSASGELIDRAGIGIRLTHDVIEATPDVASDGRDFLVVWQQAGGSSTVFQYAAARVGGDGRVLDAAPLILGPASLFPVLDQYQSAPAVAWAGTSYVAAWLPPTFNPDNVETRRCGPDGALGPVRTVLAAPAGGTVGRVALAATATTTLVAWEQAGSGGADIRYARMDAAGAVLDPAGRTATVAAADRSQPSVATDGTNFLLAWNARVASGSRAAGVYGAVLSPDATAVGPTVTYFGPAADRTEPRLGPAAAFDGTNYLVAWSNYVAGAAPSVMGSRLARTGALVDAAPRALAGPSFGVTVGRVAAAGGGGGAHVVWQDSPAAMGVHVGTDGAAGPSRVVSEYAGMQLQADVAADGTGFLAVWTSQSAGTAAVAARVNASGLVLDPTPLRLSPAGAAIAVAPAVAFDGTDYLTTWIGPDNGGYSVRVSRAGALVGGPNAITAVTGPLVVGGGTVLGRLPGAAVLRLGLDGRMLDSGPIRLPSLPAGGIYTSALGYDGTNFLGVWSEASSPTYLLRAARINADGDVIDTAPIQIPLARSRPPRAIAVAFDGTNYLVAWQDSEDDPALPGAGVVFASRLRPDGTVLDPTPARLSGPSLGNRGVAAAYDGRSFVVAWSDALRGGGGDILGTRVSTAGAALDPALIPLATNPAAAETEPRLAANPDGRSLLLYRRLDVPTVSRRLYGRIVIFGSDAGVFDAGVLDAGPADAGPPDTGPRDAGTPTADLPAAVDGGPLDAAADRPATPDATAPDTGAPATDVPADLGVVDADDVPAAGEDASVEPGDLGVIVPVDAPRPEAGIADAAVAADAGAAPDDGGGLCSVGAVGNPPAPGRAGAATLAFALVSRARRRARRSGRGGSPRGR